MEQEKRQPCPRCGAAEGQMKNGKNRSGTQSMLCRHCRKSYTIEPKEIAYSEEKRILALKIYYAGVSGRGVGKILNMSKANVYNWIKRKKNEMMIESSLKHLEIDEMYWFIGKKARNKARKNVYLMTMVNRKPRQIVGFDVAFDKSPKRIQKIVDNTPYAKKYHTDGWLGYMDVVYPGEHVRNCRDKSDTFTVEGINADLRYYIPVLARKSRCFSRNIETLRTVVEVFAEAYNKFGIAKMNYRKKRKSKSRELPFSVMDFFNQCVLSTPSFYISLTNEDKYDKIIMLCYK